MPLLSFDSAFSMRIPLVSAFLPEVTQQIHSLRASGVTSSHTACAFGADLSAFFRSRGSLCGIAVFVMSLLYPRSKIGSLPGVT